MHCSFTSQMRALSTILSVLRLTCPGAFPFFALGLACLLRSWDVACEKLIAKCWIGVGKNCSAQFFGQPQHKTNIVDCAQARVELLLSSQEMMDVAGAIMLAGVAVTALFDRPLHGAKV